jgi:hypothetical protein
MSNAYLPLSSANLRVLAQANDAGAIAEIARRQAKAREKLASGNLSYTRAKSNGLAEQHPSHATVMAAKAGKAVSKAVAAAQPPVAKAAKVAAPEPVLTRTTTRLTIKAVNARVDDLAKVVEGNSQLLARIASKLGA